MAELSPSAQPPPPTTTTLELAQTTMASHQKRSRQNQTLLSEAAEISVQTGRRGHGALWLRCHVNLHFIIKHTRQHADAHTHTHTRLDISAQGSALPSKVDLNTLKLFCRFKEIVSKMMSRCSRMFISAAEGPGNSRNKLFFCAEGRSQTFVESCAMRGGGGSLQSGTDNSARLSNLRFQMHAKCENSQFLKGV